MKNKLWYLQFSFQNVYLCVFVLYDIRPLLDYLTDSFLLFNEKTFLFVTILSFSEDAAQNCYFVIYYSRFNIFWSLTVAAHFPSSIRYSRFWYWLHSNLSLTWNDNRKKLIYFKYKNISLKTNWAEEWRTRYLSNFKLIVWRMIFFFF